LVLITLDTLRADRLGCYGYAAAETPALDRLAREGTLFERAVAVAPLTRPAHATILTGRYPFEHGLRDNISPALPESIPTLAQRLGASGYHSAGLVATFLLNRSSGLHRGFDLFSDAFDPEQRDRQFVSSFQRRGEEVVDEALAYLEAAEEPFFLWLHLYDPHTPYDPPEPFRSRHAGRPYDGEVAYADHQVGRLIDRLEASGRLDRSLVIATADHGEGLGQHGELEHSFFVYDSTLRVPLLLRLPGVVPAGRRIAQPVSQIDLVPTALDLLGLPAAALAGRSLRPLWQREPAAPESGPPLYAESLYAWLHFGWAPLRSLIQGSLKLIEAPAAELYDLVADPGETVNLAQQRPRDLLRLQDQLRALAGARAGAAPAPALDAETVGALSALGYVGGAAAGSEAAGPRRDPKQGLVEFQEFHGRLQRAIQRYSSGRQDEALRDFEALAGHSIQSFEAHYYLAKLKAEAGDHPAAVAQFERARALLPSFAPLTFDLARSLMALDQGERAAELMDAALRDDPANPELLLFRGFVRQRLRRFEAAADDYTALLALDPLDAEAGLRLSECRMAQARWNQARDQLRTVLGAKPESAAGWNNLGVVEQQLGALEAAREAFERAQRLEPDNARTRFNLGVVLEALGRREAALAAFGSAWRLDPDLNEARDRLAALEGAFRLRHIVLGSRAEAERVRALLLEGADFAVLVRERSLDPSAGGELGLVRRGELLDALETAAFALAPGQLSEPVRTIHGYHLIQRLP
ncbi:MAG TPA: sulfatase-like hydrolase/transferase, partial [Acidobacteriota bacterium]